MRTRRSCRHQTRLARAPGAPLGFAAALALLTLALALAGCDRDGHGRSRSNVRDLSDYANWTARFEGGTGVDGSFFSGTFAVGDVNGDGFDDLAIGERSADFTGRTDSGSIVVFFGGSRFPTSGDLDLGRLASVPVRIHGASASDGVGTEMEIADINGDRVGDLIFSSNSDFNGRADSGSVHVLLGGAGFPFGPGGNADFRETLTTIQVDLAEPGSSRIRWDGASAADLLGNHVIASGDVNGDGFRDVLLGARSDANGRVDSGSVYVIFGGPAIGTGVRDLADPANFDIRYDGAAAGDSLGVGFSGRNAGDVRGDGFADLALVAIGADNNGRADSGSVYVIHGGPGIPTGVRDMAALANYHLRYDGAGAGDQLGSDNAFLDDFTGDGVADLGMAAVGTDFNGRADSGSLYLRFGSAALPTSSGNTFDLALPANYDVRFDGAAAGDSFRGIYAAGDWNADGVRDFVIVAAGESNNGRASSGSAYVKFGSPALGAGAQDRDLAALANTDIRYDSAAAGDFMDRAASGRFNGDAFDDLVLGALSATRRGRSRCGTVYLLFGPLAPVTPIDLAVRASYGSGLDGAANGDRLTDGLVDTGDVNGDGATDLVVGAQGADFNGRLDSGSVYVVFGPGTGAGPAPMEGPPAAFDIRYDGATADDALGESVAVGDVNGDGFADILMGAFRADFAGRADSGVVYVVFGGPAIATGARDLAVAANADVAYGGAGAGDLLGSAVLVADVNGGGGDVVMGAHRHAFLGRGGAGATFIRFGGAGLPVGVRDLSLPGEFSVRIGGAAAGDGLPEENQVSSGDFDLDGFADLLLGTTDATFNGRATSGGAYLVLGGPGLPPGDVDMAIPASFRARVEGASAGHRAGGVLLSDVTGDGVPDLVAGAFGADPRGRADAGSVYVVSGAALGPGPGTLVDLAAAASVFARLDGAAAGDELTVASQRRADLDGNGIADLWLAARRSDAAGRFDGGSVYWVAGGPALDPGIYDLAWAGSFRLRWDGASVSDQLRTSHVADVTGDGVADLLLGAFVGDGLTFDAGLLYLIQGPVR